MKAPGWKTLPAGGLITEAGNAVTYNTGSWRTVRPAVDKQACRDCLICWVYCPEGAVKIKDTRFLGIDYAHCKGCGICASVCPQHVIEMQKE